MTPRYVYTCVCECFSHDFFTCNRRQRGIYTHTLHIYLYPFASYVFGSDSV